MGVSRLGRLGAACLALVAVLVIRAAPAFADNVDTLINQLANGSDYKTRLSAAIALSKLSDQRAVQAFINALGDDDKNVRGAAAIGLSKVVNSQTKPAMVKKAIAALEDTAANDSSSFVQKQAQKALDTLKELGGGGGGNANAGIYVNIGDMSAKTTDAEKMRNLMRSTTLKMFGKVATNMTTSWAGGAVPTKKQLDAKGVAGFHVDGTLTDMTEKVKGDSTIVSCKVSMYIATFPEKSVFGFLNGGASVQASTDPSDVALAHGDCVTAVVEDLVQHKIVPTIQTRSGKP
ncbi:MAG TPA: HEAT repeat domain-containing protein [Kofleriaceae bacterium]|nr:HEAT repeat domain-containing protein [Kofleriaceae bacterium]